MLHVCVQIFDVMSTGGKFFGSKQGLSNMYYLDELVKKLYVRQEVLGSNSMGTKIFFSVSDIWSLF